MYIYMYMSQKIGKLTTWCIFFECGHATCGFLQNETVSGHKLRMLCSLKFRIKFKISSILSDTLVVCIGDIVYKQ